jgi:hypothetical protein
VIRGLLTTVGAFMLMFSCCAVGYLPSMANLPQHKRGEAKVVLLWGIALGLVCLVVSRFLPRGASSVNANARPSTCPEADATDTDGGRTLASPGDRDDRSASPASYTSPLSPSEAPTNPMPPSPVGPAEGVSRGTATAHPADATPNSGALSRALPTPVPGAGRALAWVAIGIGALVFGCGGTEVGIPLMLAGAYILSRRTN